MSRKLKAKGAEKEGVPFSLAMLIVLGFYISMGALHIDPISSSLPEMALELSGNANGTIVVSSAYFLGNVLGYIYSGPFADILGRKKTAIFGMCFTLSGAFVCLLAGSIQVIVAGRFIMGCGASAAMCTGRAIGGDAGAGKASARALSFMQIISGCLAVIMPVLGNLITRATSWRAAFLLMMIVDGCLILSTMLFVKETCRTAQKGAWGRFAKNMAMSVRKPLYLCFVCAFAVGISTFYCYVSAASFVFQNDLGLSSTAYASLYSLLGLMMVGGASLSSLLTKHIQTDRIFLGAVAVQFAAAVLIVLQFLTGAASVVGVAICFGVITFTSSVVIPVGMSLALGEAGEVRGATAAVCGIIQSIMSWLFSTILSKLNGGGIGISTGCIMCVTTAIAFFLCLIGTRLKKKTAAGA